MSLDTFHQRNGPNENCVLLIIQMKWDHVEKRYLRGTFDLLAMAQERAGLSVQHVGPTATKRIALKLVDILALNHNNDLKSPPS